jgi:hypothetical protein
VKKAFGFSGIPVVILLLWSACGGSVDEKEFLNRYRELSDRRIQFRMNMKALGDSLKRQRRFSEQAIREVLADTLFDREIEEKYALWNDSVRKRLVDSQAVFARQFSDYRPLIRTWEKSEMQLDGMVQRIKDARLSESEGLDSMNIMLIQLKGIISFSDTLLKNSGKRYWAFRKDLDEYRYNLKNLRALYQKENNRP